MTTFHEGQDVEVRGNVTSDGKPFMALGKAKIVEIWTIDHWKREYTIQFPDGARAVFDAWNIRAAEEPSVMEHMEKAHRTWPPEKFG